eukprot:TRINITY_DN15624_c0_g1_i1.p1 TRINITY_DN15624_c0_g1~~TRINITY_DN15624_c0_g1_i1.p1  ORF type:complete len:126 (-),score=10.25 TRINITY_DN15624_c0_g1_i1:145-522(-)
MNSRTLRCAFSTITFSVLFLLYMLLVMQVFNALREVEDFFVEQSRRGTRLISIYESVQSTPGLLARLYLMATAGVALVRRKGAETNEVLRDLLEMARAVQVPLRCIFARYYIVKKTKEVLPDKGE